MPGDAAQACQVNTMASESYLSHSETLLLQKCKGSANSVMREAEQICTSLLILRGPPVHLSAAWAVARSWSVSHCDIKSPTSHISA